MSALMFVLAVLVGFLVGILTGFGVGGGTVLMIYLTTVAGIEAAAAKGINLLYFFPCSISSLIFHFKAGFVERKLLLPAIIPGVICAAATAWLAASLDQELFTKLFGIFLVIIGIRELFAKKKN